MKPIPFLGLALVAATLVCPTPTRSQAAGPPASGPKPEGGATLGNRPERLVWLQDAGFGMFIHWSLDSQLGSVISHSMVGASTDYLEWFTKELPLTFDPTRWDPNEIAALARLCGMRYVVLTAKHHSGFCLWDTDTTDFKITNTPYGEDILTGYVNALRRHGLQVGLYYSPEDFAWLYRNGHPVCRRGDQLLDPDVHPAYRDFVRRQVAELFSRYGRIDMLFIDGIGAGITKEVAWTLQPDCLITRGAIETPEQFVPGRPPEGPWESNMTMGTQWQYKPTHEEYKSGPRIIEILIETRAKGGSLMLNVGPKPNGELPIEQESRLRELALWRAVNGEAIHATRPWIVPREEDIWFTKAKQPPTVYAFLTRVPDWKRGERKTFLIRSIKTTPPTTIEVLGHAGEINEYAPGQDVTPRYRQTGEGLEISVCRAQRLYNNHKWHNPIVVKLTDVKPAFDATPYAETGNARASGDGKVAFAGNLLELAGESELEVGFEYQEYLGFAEVMYNTEWRRSALLLKRSVGAFQVEVSGMRPGVDYQYRAIVRHPKITIRGDNRRVTVK